jgi:hypothetical protein
MAMRFRATLHDFIDLLHVFPTMAEALKTVPLALQGSCKVVLLRGRGSPASALADRCTLALETLPYGLSSHGIY